MSCALTYLRLTSLVTTAAEGLSAPPSVIVGIVDWRASFDGTIFQRLSPMGTEVNPLRASTESRMRSASSGETLPGR